MECNTNLSHGSNQEVPVALCLSTNRTIVNSIWLVRCRNMWGCRIVRLLPICLDLYRVVSKSMFDIGNGFSCFCKLWIKRNIILCYLWENLRSMLLMSLVMIRFNKVVLILSRRWVSLVLVSIVSYSKD